MKYLKKIVDKFNSRNVNLFGCSISQIEEIEYMSGGELPVCYKEFLNVMGIRIEEDKSKPDYYDYGSFVGNAVFYEDLFDSKEALQELLDEDESEL